MASGGFSNAPKARQFRKKGKTLPVAIENDKGVTKFYNMTPEEAEEAYQANPQKFKGANRWIKEDDHKAKKQFLANMKKIIQDENAPTPDEVNDGGVSEGADNVGFFTGKTPEQKKQEEEKAKREKEAEADRATEIVRNDIVPEVAAQERGEVSNVAGAKGIGVEGTEKVRLTWRIPSHITQAQRGFLQPLLNSSGTHLVLEFPYSPTINIGHQASYGSYELTHSNYQQQYYMMTANPQIDMTAQFTANTKQDAAHAMASLHFLKSMMKSQFGQNDPSGERNEYAGMPPPVCEFTAYGALNFRNTPVIIRSVNYTYPEDTDFVGMVFNESGWVFVGDFYDKNAGYQQQKNDKLNELQSQFNSGAEGPDNEIKNVPGGASYIPTLFLISIGLTVQLAPSRVRTQWNWDEYMQGNILYKGYP